MQAENGIAGSVAPEWDVAQWFNLPPNQAKLRLGDLDGRVVYLFAFQSWCPGCHSWGFPALVETRRAVPDPSVAFVAVQTVFEGFDVNTAQAAKASADRYHLDIPVGHDVGPDGQPSPLMRDYRSGGTPWVVLIDADRVVRFNGFHLPVGDAVRALEQLVAVGGVGGG